MKIFYPRKWGGSAAAAVAAIAPGKIGSTSSTDASSSRRKATATATTAALTLLLLLLLTSSRSVVYGQEEGGGDSNGSIGSSSFMYRRTDGNNQDENTICTTLQMVPGNEGYNNQDTTETGVAFFLKYEDCERTCTELGTSCLGFEYQVFARQEDDVGDEPAFQPVQCRFWNRRPIEFELIGESDGVDDEATASTTSSQTIESSICTVKDFLQYPGEACEVGFISPPRDDDSLSSLLLTDVATFEECFAECSTRTVNNDQLPIFGYTTNPNGNCYGFRYNSTTSVCRIYDTPLFNGVVNEDETAATIERIETVEGGGIDVCFVRTQTFSPSA